MIKKDFSKGQKVVLTVTLVVIALVVGFYALNSYIYNEKQGDSVVVEPVLPATDIPVFTWRFEKASSLNLDGFPNTGIFLDAKYADGSVESKLIDTTSGSCNDLPDKEKDSVLNSTNIQCYSAGLGYTFKITQGEKSYLVQRKTFEEAIPGYIPVAYVYEVIAEFPLSTATSLIEYKNTEYGFTFSLPESWIGYSIVKNTWQGNPTVATDAKQTGPKLLIRNPQWTSNIPYEDIPVLIFTVAQWNAYIAEDFAVSAAPIQATELARNNVYVFALPPRWDYDYSKGYEEAQNIVKMNPLKAYSR